MKLKNILVTNEKRELVYVGEDIRPVVMNVYMSEPLGYGAGRMMMDDEFLLFLPDVSIISEEERKRFYLDVNKWEAVPDSLKTELSFWLLFTGTWIHSIC